MFNRSAQNVRLNVKYASITGTCKNLDKTNLKLSIYIPYICFLFLLFMRYGGEYEQLSYHGEFHRQLIYNFISNAILILEVFSYKF